MMVTVNEASLWHDIGIPYPQWALTEAAERGWDGSAHLDAVLAMDDDAISATHPYLFLPEVEGFDYDAAVNDGQAIYTSWQSEWRQYWKGE